MPHRPRTLALALAAYLATYWLGQYGYVLCVESDGHATIEAVGTCACPWSSGPGSSLMLHGPGDCGPCSDQSLTTDVYTRATGGIDAPVPPATLDGYILSRDDRATRLRSSFGSRDAAPDAALRLLRSTILLI